MVSLRELSLVIPHDKLQNSRSAIVFKRKNRDRRVITVRIHHSTKARKLYRKINTTTWGVDRNDDGGEYRWQRHSKKKVDENLPSHEGMHGRRERGRDYTPLYKFLLSKVGQLWDDVYSEAVSRLDTSDPIFHMVMLRRKEWRSYVRCGESSFYSGLCIDDEGLLQKVNPSFTAEDVPVRCDCCTYTFNGEPVPVTSKNWMKSIEQEDWE